MAIDSKGRKYNDWRHRCVARDRLTDPNLTTRDLAAKYGYTFGSMQEFLKTEKYAVAQREMEMDLDKHAASIVKVAREELPNMLRKTIAEAGMSTKENNQAWSQRKWLIDVAARFGGMQSEKDSTPAGGTTINVTEKTAVALVEAMGRVASKGPIPDFDPETNPNVLPAVVEELDPDDVEDAAFEELE